MVKFYDQNNVDFDEIEEMDLEEIDYCHSCNIPRTDEQKLYEWLMENRDAPSREVVSRLKMLSPYSFVRRTSVSDLRELLRMDLSHCEERSFQKAEAIRLFMEGESMTHSTGICESPTQGYGRLGHYGYWEHPISEADLKRAETDEGWCLRKGRLK